MKEGRLNTFCEAFVGRSFSFFVCLLVLALTLMPYELFATSSESNADTLTIAERNARMGFNDTIDRTADDFVLVSLVVADPSEVLYSTLGHAALHLQCPAFNLDYIFTDESEDVRAKVWSYLKGDLKMGMSSISPQEFIEHYQVEGRGVKEYKMNLSPAQKQKLWEVLDRHVAAGSNLPYDYFHRGCAKSVVQVMHEAIGAHAIYYAPWSDKYKKQTQREIVRNYITDAPWAEFLLYFLIGVDGDKDYPCEQKLIVPTDLVEVWQQATLDNGQKVIDSEPTILLEAAQHNKGTWCTPLLVSLILLILAIGSWVTTYTNNKVWNIAGVVVDYLILAIISIAGALMVYLVFFSKLPCTTWNWLIIPFNILPLLVWYWRKYWALPYAIVMGLWCAVMIYEWFFGHVIVDWPHIILALSFGVILLKSSKTLNNKKHKRCKQN